MSTNGGQLPIPGLGTDDIKNLPASPKSTTLPGFSLFVTKLFGNELSFTLVVPMNLLASKDGM